ncbi:hypothetical protein ACOMHN_038657 [Nucella lapillus]
MFHPADHGAVYRTVNVTVGTGPSSCLSIKRNRGVSMLTNFVGKTKRPLAHVTLEEAVLGSSHRRPRAFSSRCYWRLLHSTCGKRAGPSGL